MPEKSDSLHARYPMIFASAVDFLTEGGNQRFSEEKAADFYAQIDAVLDSFGAAAKCRKNCEHRRTGGAKKDGNLILDPDIVDSADARTAAYVTQIDLISLSFVQSVYGHQQNACARRGFSLYCVRGS